MRASDSCARESAVPFLSHPERPTTKLARIQYVIELMAAGLWWNPETRMGVTAEELGAVWGLSPSTVRDYSAQATAWRTILKDRETLIGMLQVMAFNRAQRASDRDFIGLAGYLSDTVGGFSQKHEVTVETKPHDPTEVSAGCVAWLKEHDPKALAEACPRCSQLVLTEGESE